MELQSTSNFCMLTEHLHILFKRYIINGRVRAPPEFELSDMIPTFQQGAKTNRRALQSKFKSWAKRMTLLNGNLVLSSSGKIIIPQERCEEIIMELHYDNHMVIEKVITKIQKKYTWSKKNFGMDIEVVMNAILNNCKNATCKKELGKVIKTYFKKLYQGFPVSTVPQPFFRNSNIERAEFYGCSMEMLPSDRVSRIEYPILQSYLSNRGNTLGVLPKNRMRSLTRIANNENHENIFSSKTNEYYTEPKLISRKCNIPQSASLVENQSNKSGAICSRLQNKKKQYFSKSLDTMNENELEKVYISSSSSIPSATLHKNNQRFLMKSDDSSRNHHSLTRSCKKPKNFDEFKKQLIDAQIYPEIYPALFTDPKSQFLSSLGLVPKRLCSKRTLVKVTREQRKKRLMEKRRSWFVVERKVLRDRNKLNKRSSHNLRTRPDTYGRISKPCSSSFHYSPQQNSQKVRNNFKKLKNIAKRPLRGHTETPRMMTQRLLLPREAAERVKKSPEIIDISSSEDESQASQTFVNVKTELPEYEIQPTSSSEQNGSSQYVDPRLFGCNVVNAEAVRNQLFFDQNFGYNGIFGTPNIFFNQNNVADFPVTSNNQPYQLNNSFYMNSQTQFPILRPFFIPALPNGDIAVLPSENFPMIRPLGPVTTSSTSSYFNTTQPLTNNTNAITGKYGNLADEKQCLFVPNGKAVAENKESFTNINPVQPNQASQPSPNFKVFIVNKTPKKTYLLVPPDCKAYINTAKKIIPILDRKQPIAPRTSGSEKSPLNSKTTVAKLLQRRRLNNTLSAHVNYSSKQIEAKKDIQRGMGRLSNWISKLKTSITPTSFNKGVEKFSQRLTNELNVGISLVRGVRNTLIEIEKNEEDIAENFQI